MLPAKIISPAHLPGTEEAPSPLDMLLADKRSPATRRAYRGDLVAFFEGEPSPEVVRDFLTSKTPAIALKLHRWKAAMLAAGLAEATVNRRLSAVRSLLKLGHRLGLTDTDGRGLVEAERVVGYRDTRGILLTQMRRLLANTARDGEKGARDAVLLRLLLENGLRRAEVCALDVGDFHFAERRLFIVGKGRGTQREPVTVSRALADALARYLMHRGAPAGDVPLFTNMDRNPARRGRRLTTQGLYGMVGRAGVAIGEEGLTPHKLRHSCITAALDATGGDVRKVQRLSRHAKLETLMRYDDARRDDAGEVVAKLSALLEE